MHKEGRVIKEADNSLTDRNQSDDSDPVECPEGTCLLFVLMLN